MVERTGGCRDDQKKGPAASKLMRSLRAGGAREIPFYWQPQVAPDRTRIAPRAPCSSKGQQQWTLAKLLALKARTLSAGEDRDRVMSRALAMTMLARFQWTNPLRALVDHPGA